MYAGPVPPSEGEGAQRGSVWVQLGPTRQPALRNRPLFLGFLGFSPLSFFPDLTPCRPPKSPLPPPLSVLSSLRQKPPDRRQKPGRDGAVTSPLPVPGARGGARRRIPFAVSALRCWFVPNGTVLSPMLNPSPPPVCPGSRLSPRHQKERTTLAAKMPLHFVTEFL